MLRPMKIKASDGRTYEVKSDGGEASFDVLLGSDIVGGFVLEEEETKITLRGTKTTTKILHEIADEFVDRGGAPMKMM